MAPYVVWRELHYHSHHRVRDLLVNWQRWRRLHIRNVMDLVAALILVMKWRRAPVDALAVLNTKKTTETPSGL
jgi:hypothetical protein